MTQADELVKLKTLLDDGALTEQEFEEAKRHLLEDPPAGRTSPWYPGSDDEPFEDRYEHSLGRAANRWVTLQLVGMVLGFALVLYLFAFHFLPQVDRIGPGF